MRTTLTIDDDLAGILKRRARELGVPYTEVVNRALRAGLGDDAKPSNQPPPQVIPHSFGLRPGIDPDKLNQLLDEMDGENYAAEMAKLNDPSRR